LFQNTKLKARERLRGKVRDCKNTAVPLDRTTNGKDEGGVMMNMNYINIQQNETEFSERCAFPGTNKPLTPQS